jgi:hypothetical protein
MELIFYYHHYFEVKKVKLIVIKCTNYIIIWWDHCLIKEKEFRETHKDLG